MNIEVTQGGKTIVLSIPEAKKISLLEILRENDIQVRADCGGKGRCFKCEVKISQGATDATAADLKHFSEEEIKEGYRLSCLSFPKADMKVEVPEYLEDEMEVDSHTEHSIGSEKSANDKPSKYGFAIDIGTTTIAISLVDVANRKIVDTYSGVNHQRQWGSDVIARIQASNDGEKDELQNSIICDLKTGIESLLKKYSIGENDFEHIVISGNTTMGHLLMGFSCEGLGVVPFTPVDISTITVSSKDLLGAFNAEITLTPGVSTYVGGDITSGMLVTNMCEEEGLSFLLDIGTNGEMALANKDKCLVTSTAAGPAFEGGQIKCGMASVPGAISAVDIKEDDTVALKTIGDKAPIGFCGTGVLEAICELVKKELIDETGVLDDDYFDDGYEFAKSPDGDEIRIFQEDIRQIQLAKSAIRAGMETLIEESGASYDDIKNVYIAGGFGYRINLEKAVGIGLLPEELLPKMKAVGNTSLQGSVEILNGFYDDEAKSLSKEQNNAIKRAERIVSDSKEVDLSTSKLFNEYYMEYMMFE